MSIAQKQAAAQGGMSEPTIACPSCDTQTTPRDLPAHMAERCPGPRPPGPRSTWVPFRDAVAAGVPRATLSRWTHRGQVRSRGDVRGDREYMLRDLAMMLAQRRIRRR